MIRRLVLVYFFAMGLGLSGQVHATSMPPMFDGPNVLPVGKSTFSFSLRYSSLAETLVGRPSSGRLLREVTWREAIAATPEGRRAALQSLQESHGRNDDDVLVREFVETKGYRVALQPLWLFGLGECITVGARIPVIAEQREIGRRAEWTEAVGETMLALTPTSALAGAASSGVRESVALEGFHSGAQYRIGDVEIFGQYIFQNRETWALAARPKLVLPTAPSPDPYHVDALLLDEGQLDAGIELLAEWRLSSRWSLLATEGYLAQLPDRVAMRIPDGRQAILQSDLDRDVRRDAGDIVSGEIQVRYRAHPLIALGTSYQRIERGSESFKGSRYAQSRYDALARGTSGLAEQGRLNVIYTPPPATLELIKEVRLLSAYVDVTKRLDVSSEWSAPIAEIGATFAY